jgi:hypothetical protein
MLVWGTVNPSGESDDGYRGFYLTHGDIRRCVDSREIIDKPVKIEHKGADIGRVVSAWCNAAGQMDCLLEVHDNKSLEGAVIAQFVGQGLCKELSLGYLVDVQNSARGVCASNKRIIEVSIVKKGARDRCYIHGFTPRTG